MAFCNMFACHSHPSASVASSDMAVEIRFKSSTYMIHLTEAICKKTYLRNLSFYQCQFRTLYELPLAQNSITRALQLKTDSELFFCRILPGIPRQTTTPVACPACAKLRSNASQSLHPLGTNYSPSKDISQSDIFLLSPLPMWKKLNPTFSVFSSSSSDSYSKLEVS